MDDRLLNRRFHSALTAETAHGSESWNSEAKQKEAEQDEEALLRRAGNPMDAKDAIKRILLAKKDKDLFRLLELPPPEMDALDRVTWNVSSADVSKAYRRLSVLVHPDKNPGNDAREAFEALNEAHRQLRDRGGLEEMLSKHADAASKRREAVDASATAEERIAMFAAKQEQAKQLRKKEGESLQAQVLRQMKEKQLAAKRKREMVARSTYRREEELEEEDEDDETETVQEVPQQGAAKKECLLKPKKKPKLIF